MNSKQQGYYLELCIISESKGGKVISLQYVNSETEMTFECGNKHQWTVQAKRVKTGTWCRECLGRSPKQGEANFRRIVEEKGGRVLGIYINARSKVEVECFLGHRWPVTPNHVVSSGSWCDECYIEHHSAEQRFYQIVASKGGRVLGIYFSTQKQLELECVVGHRWFARPNDILADKWCRNCAFRIDICEQEFRNAVTSKGGIVLGEYIDTNTNVLTQCHLGHRWMPCPSWVRRGGWCSQCGQSRGELEVSESLIKLGITFSTECKHHLLPTKRYDFYFFYNGTHYLLEFDGIQHFEYNTLFYSDDDEFRRRQMIDCLKTYIAISTGYRMIRIDYTQLGKVYQCIVEALKLQIPLIVSLPQMYSWLGSTIPIEVIQKECPVLLSI